MKTFVLGEWKYVDAGGIQLWREKEVWEVDGLTLKNPVKQREPLSIKDFIAARKIATATPEKQ